MKATKEELVLHSLKWHSPYTEPPAGQPRVLVEEILPRSMPSVVVERLWYPGCGYSCNWSLLAPPVRRELSLETKQRIRRKNLVRRMEKNAPLFAEQMIAQKLEAQPDYFGAQ